MLSSLSRSSESQRSGVGEEFRWILKPILVYPSSHWTISFLLLDLNPGESLTADFQNLLSALNPNPSEDEVSSQDVIRVPTGASQERVSGILQWILPPLTEFYNTRVGLLKPAFNEMMLKNPLLSRNRGGADRPLTAEPSKRRSSVSELLWTNNFLETHLQSSSAENEVESLSSGNTFISSGLEKSTTAIQNNHLIEEEFDPEDLEKIRQNARIAGIGMTAPGSAIS